MFKLFGTVDASIRYGTLACEKLGIRAERRRLLEPSWSPHEPSLTEFIIIAQLTCANC